VPFTTFNAKLALAFAGVGKTGSFELQSSFTLSSTNSNGINPLTDPVTLQVGTFTTTIPPGSFKTNGKGLFAFKGVIGGVGLEALIASTGTLRYVFEVTAQGPNLSGTKNPVYVTLAVGDDSGVPSVNAAISPVVKAAMSH
jgi:hypothetical protein